MLAVLKERLEKNSSDSDVATYFSASPGLYIIHKVKHQQERRDRNLNSEKNVNSLSHRVSDWVS